MKKIVFLATLIFLFSCNEKEALDIPTVKELYPLKAGKVFLYRLDSTVLTNANQNFVTKSYIAKDTIESEFADAQGRQSFRIFRYKRDTLQTQPWKYIATYYATFTDNTIEFVDNNLRFITLANPITENNNWNGTAYLNVANTGTSYSYYNNWQYNYQQLNAPFTTKKGVIPASFTVAHANDSIIASFKIKNFSKEVYAKNVGLIYKDFLHYEWQTSSTGGNYTEYSYGLKLNLIDYY